MTNPAFQAAFARAIDLAGEIVERRSTIPILGNVRLIALEGTMMLEASDLDIEISCGLGKVPWPYFDTTVPFEILKRIAEQPIAKMGVAEKGELEIVTAADVTYDLNTLPASDFPHLKPFNPTCSFTISAHDLFDSLDNVRAGISTEETRYYLNGVFMHRVPASAGFMGDHLRFAATDGHRLFVSAGVLPKGAEELVGLIIPRNVVKFLLKALDPMSDDMIAISVNEPELRIMFALPGIVIAAKTIDGTYPDYSRVIPPSVGPMFHCNAAELVRAAEAVAAISCDRTRALVMTVDAGGCHLEAKSPENGHAFASVKADVGESDGMPDKIGLNARYLIDSAKVFGNRRIRISTDNSAAPVLMTSPGDSSLTVVQMPMRV